MHQGEVVHTRLLEDDPVHIGRSSSNDLVLSTVDVSGHHAILYREAGQVLLKDLNSSNGTFLNGDRVRHAVPVQPGDSVRFGRTAVVSLSGGAPIERLVYRLQRVDSDLVWPVRGPVFELADHADAALVFSGEEPWLAVDGEQVEQVAVGEPFTVDGVPYVLCEVEGATAETVRPNDSAYPYHLEVQLGEGKAALLHPKSRLRCDFNTENRAALLYALGERWLADGPGPGRGWMDDRDLAIAVWGRAHRDQGSNNLHVLVHRVRSEAGAAGFERWFIEKRRGRTRVQVRQVTLR